MSIGSGRDAPYNRRIVAVDWLVSWRILLVNCGESAPCLRGLQRAHGRWRRSMRARGVGCRVRLVALSLLMMIGNGHTFSRSWESVAWPLQSRAARDRSYLAAASTTNIHTQKGTRPPRPSRLPRTRCTADRPAAPRASSAAKTTPAWGLRELLVPVARDVARARATAGQLAQSSP